MSKEMKFRKHPNLTSNFFWGHKTDLAEINHFNVRSIFHDYFFLSTKKIALMASMLAFNFILTIFSRYVMGLIPIASFFVLELTFFSILMFLLTTNLFYTFFFLEITIWFRSALGSEPIGLLAMNLIDGSFVLVFAFFNFLFRLWVVKFQIQNHFQKFFYFQLLIFVFASILISGLAVFLNWAFLLSLYGIPIETQKVYLFPLFGLNILKFALNGTLYFLLYYPLINLIKLHQI